MPNPKRRHSKTRGRKRRTQKLPHRACPNCGYYNGRSIVVPKAS
jgi:ribosomal protein L32